MSNARASFIANLCSSEARRLGIRIAAGRGSGKSWLMGRLIAFLDFIRGVPTVILDPHGGTIDNFLDRMMLLPRQAQQKLWKRVIYVDMSGHWGYVVPIPLYYQMGNESWFETSQRFLDVIYKQDPFLQSASVQGWNPLWLTGTMVGMVASALGLQITEALDLLERPQIWTDRLARLEKQYPELQPGIRFLQHMPDAPSGEVNRLVSSYYNKVALFTLDPITKAIVGASNPGIDWQDVVKNRKIVLFDFRHVHDRIRRQFLMEWSLQYFINFILHRGQGYQLPFSLIIDELTVLFSLQGMAPELFEADLDELINVISRQYSLWLTICHQEHFQLPENVNMSLMSLGTQILGVTRDREAALRLASYFFRYDPSWVRKYERVWMSDMMFGPFVVDHRSEEFTAEEQTLLHSYQFTDLKRFEFLVSLATSTGSVSTTLRNLSLAWFDRGFYPEKKQLEDARSKLVRYCRPIH